MIILNVLGKKPNVKEFTYLQSISTNLVNNKIFLQYEYLFSPFMGLNFIMI
jgi:hypothetical protein